MRKSIIASSLLFAALLTAATIGHGDEYDLNAIDGPLPYSRPDGTTLIAGVDPTSVWQLDATPILVARDLLFDNGPPLDDFGHPACQLSSAPAPWNFIAADADDFLIPLVQPDEVSATIRTIRVASHFFGTNAAAATPTTTWTGGVTVAVYNNTPSGTPSGQPNLAGGHLGDVVASQLVPMASLQNQVLVNICRSCFVIDIPVEITVQRNVRYWLTVIPRFNGPPQSAWVLSQNQNPGTLQSRVGFPNVGIPFWSLNPGNLNSCLGTPPAGTRTDLAFQLYGGVKIQVAPASNE